MNAGIEIPTPPQKPGQVDAQMNDLSIKIGVALNYIKELSGRLAPVVSETKESSGCVEPDMPLVPLAQRIRSASKEVESMNQQLSRILKNLEL